MGIWRTRGEVNSFASVNARNTVPKWDTFFVDKNSEDSRADTAHQMADGTVVSLAFLTFFSNLRREHGGGHTKLRFVRQNAKNFARFPPHPEHREPAALLSPQVGSQVVRSGVAFFLTVLGS